MYIFFFLTESAERKQFTSSVTLFSNSAFQSNRSNDTWCENDTIPFIVSPKSATIAPEQSQTFHVTFKPQDVFQYLVHMDGKIDNLKPDLPNLNLLISGKSILPLYHFDLDKVDLEKLREGRKLCKEPTDENLQVVTFEAIGLSEIIVR